MASAATTAPLLKGLPRPRRLWQVPTFLLGLTAFLSVWQGWVSVAPREMATSSSRERDELFLLCQELNPDIAKLNALLSRVASGVSSKAEDAAADHFALGSGYSRVAELTSQVDPARAYWTLANQHFQQIRDGLIEPADQPRLVFRAAKARVAVGLPAAVPYAEMNRLRDVLASIPPGEIGGESYRLFAELCLRTMPPGGKPSPDDLNRARGALLEYLKQPGLALPGAPRAKLRLSEICLMSSNPDEARKWLEKIGSDAPVDVLLPAKAQLARILMTAGEVDAAISQWDQVRGGATAAPLRLESAYNLGLCWLQGKNPDPARAASYLTEAARSDAAEGRAAATPTGGAELARQRCRQTQDRGRAADYRHKKAGYIHTRSPE